MISQDLIADENFNSISIEAQNIFLRMISISDDCGVVPTNTYRLNKLLNTPARLVNKIQSILDEIVSAGLGHRFKFEDETYFCFKPKAFNHYQSYILKKATKSEYLRTSIMEFRELSKNFEENPRSLRKIIPTHLSTVESRKQ